MNGVDGVDFITFDKRRGSRGLLETRRNLTGRRFPVLLHMHASMRANVVSRMVRADIRIGFDRPRARGFQWLFTNQRIAAHPEQHVMDSLFGFAESLGIADRVIRWEIPIPEADQELAASVVGKTGPVCVISPCSSERIRNFRNWRRENFAAVARYLHEKYAAQIVLTGGSTRIEKDYGTAIEADSGIPLTNLIGKTSLKQLLAVLARADLLQCPDSGPAHMATAVGTPVIGLYATSNTHRTGPYFSQRHVVDRYPEAVHREFGKPVEALRWGRRVRDPHAMDLIGVDDVKQKIDELLNSETSPAADTAL